jgi:protocatechuate 3,4-dioxygenase beta subunit
LKALIHGWLVSLAVSYGVLSQSPTADRSDPIRGQVVSAADGVPLRRARVEVIAGERRLDPVVTDDVGRFRIEGAPATPLTVRATKAGYAPGLADVSAVTDNNELRFMLTRSAAVMGRVLDPYGAPVVEAYVTGRLILPEADRTPAAARQFFTRTDGLGEYRLGSLPPGRYEIMAARIPLRTPRSKIEELLFGPASALEVGKGASTFVLSAGDEIQGVDFTMAESADACAPGPSGKPPEGVGRASIAGRVTATSGEPLACVSVMLRAPDVLVLTVVTDRQGRYSIEGLRAGSYVLEARKAGHLTLQSGQQHPSAAPTRIVLLDTEQPTRVDFVLPRGSTIRGTIVDEHGEPLEGVDVVAFQLRRYEGRMTAMVAGAMLASTDDRGQYRLIGLNPGSYIVVGTMSASTVSTADAQRAGAYLSAYHPGTPDALTAQRIVLDAGRHAEGIDIQFTPTRTVTVSGSVLDSTGQPVAGTVDVSVSGRSGAFSIDASSVPIDASGRFVMRNVLPNTDYVVKAFGPNRRQFGMQYVTVGEDDPPPVAVTVFEGATVDGRVMLEGADSPDGRGIVVTAVPTDSDFSSGLPGFATGFASSPLSTLEGGRFELLRVTGPTRLLVTAPSCEGCYVRSVLVNGANATDTPFDFGLTGVHRGVEIVVSDAGAAVEGRASDERDAPVSGYWVVVFPTSRDLWYARSPHVRGEPSAMGGPFRVTGLAPGEYFVVAVDRVEPPSPLGGELADPEVLEQLAKRAERVTLSERDRRRLNLRLIRR